MDSSKDSFTGQNIFQCLAFKWMEEEKPHAYKTQL